MAQAPTLAQRPIPTVLFLSLVPVGAWLLVRPLLDPLPPLPAFHAALGFSVFAFLATAYLVPILGPTFVKANLKGRDLLKTYDTPMLVLYHSVDSVCSRESSPESLGLVCACVYVASLILFIPFAFSDVFVNNYENRSKHGLVVAEFPHQKVRVQDRLRF